MASSLCPCGSGKNYSECCGIYIDGTTPAREAPALARSRYTAFVRKEYAYLVETTHPDFRKDLTPEKLAEGLDGVRWTGLELKNFTAGVMVPEHGLCDTLELKASCTINGMPRILEERSFFRCEDGHCYYLDGIPGKEEPSRRAEVKTGRNDPCPCGSGKKYKKCCGGA